MIAYRKTRGRIVAERVGYYRSPARRRIDNWAGMLIGYSIAFAARLLYGTPSFAFAFVALIVMAAANIVSNRLLAWSGAPAIPLADLGRTYARETAERSVLAMTLEAMLTTTVVIVSTLVVALPIEDLASMGAFLAVVPIITGLSGFVRATQARTNARALASLPDSPASPKARRVAFLKWLGRLPLLYAGTFLGVVAGAFASLHLPVSYGYAAFLLCSVAGMSAPYLILRENPLMSVAPRREPAVVRGLVMSVLVGILGWGVPFGVMLTGFLLLPMVLQGHVPPIDFGVSALRCTRLRYLARGRRRLRLHPVAVHHGDRVDFAEEVAGPKRSRPLSASAPRHE